MAERNVYLGRFNRRASGPFRGDVYSVLDLTGPAASVVRTIRARYGYDYLGAMPVEITVTGSGGVGSPKARNDLRPFFAALDNIVADSAPIHGRLSRLHRFPGTDVFVALPDDPDPILALHERIKGSGCEFDPSPFPFVPHCTLTQPPNPTPADVSDPDLKLDADFSAHTLSVYEIVRFPLLRLRYRGYFGAR
jgi:2'-5' RNA ligase